MCVELLLGLQTEQSFDSDNVHHAGNKLNVGHCQQQAQA